jgi:hypothetical protein
LSRKGGEERVIDKQQQQQQQAEKHHRTTSTTGRSPYNNGDWSAQYMARCVYAWMIVLLALFRSRLIIQTITYKPNNKMKQQIATNNTLSVGASCVWQE